METTKTSFSQAEKKIQACIKAVHKTTGISPRVAFLTTYNADQNSFDIHAFAKKRPEGLSKILQNATGERQESERLRNNKNQEPIIALSGRDYFSRMNDVKEIEKKLLEDNSYKPGLIWYFAIPLPPDTNDVIQVFFLIIENDTQKETFDNKSLSVILQKFKALS